MHRTREPDVGGGGLAEAGTGETETWWWMPWHGGSLAEEGSQARDRRVRSVAPRVVRAVEETEVAHGRGFIEIGAGSSRPRSRTMAGRALDTRPGAPRPSMQWRHSHTLPSPHTPRDARLSFPPAAVALLLSSHTERNYYTRSVHSTTPVRGFAKLAEPSRADVSGSLTVAFSELRPRSYSAPPTHFS